ncbi:uncharacterized protein LOC130405873 isoform X1 [Gadus chalcogrammus]|uniref:uncharacterized protein LOC130405873 isoform X1 n=2 Tax=Gadus chalcogrammus TaxID=1042646 RepID=UPI0024C4E169|nr:uncharacterized protein LOC130405873 isoform X1 [Gadus chalcogrammus]
MSKPLKCHQRREMCPYGLRRSIRCPKKYGDAIKERPDMLSVTCDLDPLLVPPQRKANIPRPTAERFSRNAAVLPDVRHSQGSPTAEAAREEPTLTTNGRTTEPLVIHGYAVPEYQLAYHSVVDSLLPPGQTYSLELGRTIKEHLFEELAYPTLHISEQADGRMEVVERFCVLRPTPYIAVDVKGEPPCHSSRHSQ